MIGFFFFTKKKHFIQTMNEICTIFEQIVFNPIGR